MSRDVPVVLVAHGTRDEAGRTELRALRGAAARDHRAPVGIGVIEYATAGLPPVFAALAEAADAARRSWVGAIRVVPLLLFPAGHAGDDLRVVIRGARRLHSDLRVGCVPLLRPAPALLDALVTRITEADPEGTADAVLVVGRGSSNRHANARLPARVVAALRERDGRTAAHAFASLAPPSVATALETLARDGARRIVVAPYLLNNGVIARRIGAEAWAWAAGGGAEVVVAGHLGLHAGVLDYVRARVAGDRGIAVAASASPTATPRRPRYPRPIVVAGTASGTGKTTVALGLIAALRGRGLRVQPFKVGPDYIDPLHHTSVAGRVSRNLDSVMCAPPTVTALAARAMAGADAGVVEGVLGLFDGRLGGGDAGSTAEIARLVGGSVLLVVDAARAARSTGAVALGFTGFDRRLVVDGIVLNRVGSAAHAQAAREAVEQATGVPVLGCIPRDDGLQLPERYLGLVPPQERPQPPGWADRLGRLIEANLDLDRLLAIAATGSGPVADPTHDPFAVVPSPPRARIAVARDPAFSFHYQDALDLLAHRGAELVPFSPLTDAALPECGGVVLGGGFPERFAATLAANGSMRASVVASLGRGVVAVAECGGAMYLGTGIVDDNGDGHEMCGVLPFATRMGRRRRALGYREVTALRDSPMLQRGQTAVGHEFHWSAVEPGFDADAAAYSVGDSVEGVSNPQLLASFVHLHLCGVPGAAPRLVRAAARAERVRVVTA